MTTTSEIHVDQVELKTAGPDFAEGGLLGWLTCRVNRQLRLDGLALRRTVEGRLTLSFPARRDNAGHQHPYVRPLDNDIRRAIERQVFLALGFGKQESNQ